jgi:hypothetical protein
VAEDWWSTNVSSMTLIDQALVGVESTLDADGNHATVLAVSGDAPSGP